MSIDNIQIIETVSLDFYNNNIKTINVKQLDTDARGVKIYCTEHGKKFVLNTLSHSAFVRYKKPDGNDVLNDCYIQDDGSIIFPLTQQMTVVAGKSKLDILIFCSSGLTVDDISDVTNFNDLGISTLSTMTLGLNILLNATDLENVESSYEYNALIDGLARHIAIEKHMEELENTLNTNEEERQANETNRQNAETLRETNTNKAIEACNTATSNANTATSNANAVIETAEISVSKCKEVTSACTTATTDCELAIVKSESATSKCNTATSNANAVVEEFESTKESLEERISKIITCLNTPYSLTDEVTVTEGWTISSSSATLIGNCLLYQFNVMADTAINSTTGNCENVTIMSVSVEHGGLINALFTTAFSTTHTGATTSYYINNLTVTEDTLSFSVVLTAVTPNNIGTGFSACGIIPVSRII